MWIADMLHCTIAPTVTLQSAICTALSWRLKVMLVMLDGQLSASCILETIHN